MPRLRFRPPRWLRLFVTVVAALQLAGLALDPGPGAWIQVVAWTGMAANVWLALDTVVDDDGIRTSTNYRRERIAWTDISRFALDSVGRPELVLTSGKRKRLPHVPDPARKEIQQRWLEARGIDADLG